MTKRAVFLASAAMMLSAAWLVAQPQTAPLDDTEPRMIPFIEKFGRI